MKTAETRTLTMSAARKADEAFAHAEQLACFWRPTSPAFRSPEKAMVKAAELGHPKAQEICAYRFREGTGGFRKDLNEAYRWQRQLALSRDVGAMVDLAKYYTDGLGPIQKSELNLKIGIEILDLAHEHYACTPGHGAGEYETIGALMTVLRRFVGGLSRRQKEAVRKSLLGGDYIVTAA